MKTLKNICTKLLNDSWFCSVYAEFGTASTDSAKVTLTYASGGVGTVKIFNILARQISCTSTWK